MKIILSVHYLFTLLYFACGIIPQLYMLLILLSETTKRISVARVDPRNYGLTNSIKHLILDLVIEVDTAVSISIQCTIC